MVKHYFIETNKGKEGPFTFEELSTMKLLDSTKVWHEGLDNWANINDVEELKPIVVKSPPPTQEEKEIQIEEKERKYRKKYIKLYLKENIVLYFFASVFISIILITGIAWAVPEMSIDKLLPLVPYYFLAVFLLATLTLLINLNGHANLINFSFLYNNIENDTAISAKVYVKKVRLINNDYLQYLSKDGSAVFVNDKIPNDGYYFQDNGCFVYFINNGQIIKVYNESIYNLAIGKLHIYCEPNFGIIKGNPGFLNGKSVPDGSYSIGLLRKITFKDGVVV
jgi:hypothetical protein